MPQTLSLHGIRRKLYLTKHGPVTQGKRSKLIHLLFIKQNIFICLAPKQCRIYCKDECHTLHCVRKIVLEILQYFFLHSVFKTRTSNPRKKCETHLLYLPPLQGERKRMSRHVSNELTNCSF